MKYIEKSIYELQFCIPETAGIGEHVVYFDIETTGLAASESYVYLIGTLALKENVPTLFQWLSESTAEEQKILNAFAAFLSGYTMLVHYNGASFDVPFLQKKYEAYCMVSPFLQIQSFDFYKQLRAFKKPLGFGNLKQKEVEHGFGCIRKDKLSGLELIDLYNRFSSRFFYERLRAERKAAPTDAFIVPDGSGLASISTSSAASMEALLLLHNEEDLTGLAFCMDYFYSLPFFHSSVTLAAAVIQEEQEYLKITFQLEQPIKKERVLTLPIVQTGLSLPEFCRLLLKETLGVLFVPFYRGKLNYYFSDYKDYFYLPEEGIAVHKSVATFVDPSFRVKATKETACKSKTSSFLPQPVPLFTPEFKPSSKSKVSFFEITEQFLMDQDALLRYVKAMLEQLS